MHDIESAEKLAKEMTQIGELTNKQTVCVITSMDEPLGYAVGNSLEVIEAIECLKGNMPKDIEKVVLELGSQMIKLAGLGDDIQKNKDKMMENIKNGKAYEKFIQLVKQQNGDISYIQDTEKFPKAKYIKPIYCKKEGYIQEINAEQVGKLTCRLGAGRIRKEDQIDETVGIVFNKKVGDKVEQNDVLAYIHANSLKSLEEEKNLLEIIKIGEKELKKTINMV